MKAFPSDIGKFFGPLIGQHPKRARPGHGSFLMLDVGRPFKQNRRLQYEWHLWIRDADWQLTWTGQPIASSESKRQVIQAAVGRLGAKALEKVARDQAARETRFIFSNGTQLTCKAYSDSREDEHCWLLYMPDAHVLIADGSGELYYLRSDVPEPVHSPA